METSEMGRVTVEVTLSNVGDLYEVSRGKLLREQVRKVMVKDALIDTGATTMALTPSLIKQLGLVKQFEKRAMTASGSVTVNVYDLVRVDISDRHAMVEPIEVPEGNPVLIGQVPLELMDWVVDVQGRKLIGNPAHDGQHVLELL